MDNDYALKALCKVTYALGMAVVQNPNSMYCLKSHGSTIDSSSVGLMVWLHDSKMRRIVFADTSKDLLDAILKSPYFTVPLQKNVWNSYTCSRRSMKNPFYGMAIEEALVKIDLENCNEQH